MNSTWRPLPDDLAAEHAHLVRVLRDLKDRSGLSLAGLAATTAYSKSAWDRYLNGTKFPPQHAVRELAVLTAVPADRVVALWGHADTSWSRRASTVADPKPPPTAPPARSSTRGWRVGAGKVVAVLAIAALAATAFAVRAVYSSAGNGLPDAVVAAPGCRGPACAGLDASSMGCDADAVTRADVRVGAARLELRVSAACQAAWARVSLSRATTTFRVLDQAGHAQELTVGPGAADDRFVSTAMIGSIATTAGRACLHPPDGDEVCTAWVRSR
jgi:helix-turn-helix protein/uncharacterized protein DUF2690